MEHWKGGQFYLGNYICFVIIAIFCLFLDSFLVQYTIQKLVKLLFSFAKLSPSTQNPSPETAQISVSPETEHPGQGPLHKF